MSNIQKLREHPEALSVREIAVMLRVSEATIQKWVRKGILPAFSAGDSIRFNPREVADWIEMRHIEAQERLRNSIDRYAKSVLKRFKPERALSSEDAAARKLDRSNKRKGPQNTRIKPV